jgi:hypothetical protein
MFAIPGILALIVLVYVHPQDIFERLRLIPLLNYAFGAALLGWFIDLRLRTTRLYVVPLIGWSAAYYAWSLLTLALWDPAKLADAAAFLAIPFAMFFVISAAVQSLRALQTVAAVLLAIALFICAIGIHQHFAPTGCFGYSSSALITGAVYDGRPCEKVEECQPGEPGNSYLCEHVGLFGTSTIAGRSRWVGFLNDPNEVAMAVSMCVPFAFAFFLLKRSAGRFALLAVTLAMVVACDIFTGSRGGQLVFLAAIGVYFYRRYGARGLLLGGLLVLPVLLLGGRSDEGATESSQGRIELLGVAMGLFRLHPFAGVGYSNFGEYASHTAHNSYALVAAESGFPGLLLWTALIYGCLKSTMAALTRYEKRPEAEAAYVWAGALLSAQCGLLVGIFFLSFNFSSILWVFMGICAAFYAVIQRHDPEFRVSLDWTDWKRIVVMDLIFVSVLFVYTRIVTE